MGLITQQRIPYLRPEIQLLYKGGGASYRTKDFDDLKLILPLLSGAAVAWLLSALQTAFPGGHDWITYIQQHQS